MKNFNFAVLDKNVLRRNSPLIAPALIIVAAFMAGNQSFADGFPFRAVYADVPGANEVEAGNFQAGIKILEDQLNQVEQGNSGDIWATLCAAYIVSGSLDQAERPCNKAVELDPTYCALNNRGVFRVFKGDLSGAREDFERVRPRQLEAYLEELMTKNVRVVAADNFRLVNELSAKRRVARSDASVAVNTAEIEEPNH